MPHPGLARKEPVDPIASWTTQRASPWMAEIPVWKFSTIHQNDPNRPLHIVISLQLQGFKVKLHRGSETALDILYRKCKRIIGYVHKTGLCGGTQLTSEPSHVRFSNRARSINGVYVGFLAKTHFYIARSCRRARGAKRAAAITHSGFGLHVTRASMPKP